MKANNTASRQLAWTAVACSRGSINETPRMTKYRQAAAFGLMSAALTAFTVGTANADQQGADPSIGKKALKVKVVNTARVKVVNKPGVTIENDKASPVPVSVVNGAGGVGRFLTEYQIIGFTANSYNGRMQDADRMDPEDIHERPLKGAAAMNRLCREVAPNARAATVDDLNRSVDTPEPFPAAGAWIKRWSPPAGQERRTAKWNLLRYFSLREGAEDDEKKTTELFGGIQSEGGDRR